MRHACFLFVAIVVGAAFAEDDLTSDAKAYLAKHSTPEADAKWRKWWAGRAEEILASRESISSEEAAADEFMTAWFRSRSERFKKKPPEITTDEKVTLCRFYMLYKDRGWMIPERVAEHITKKKYDEVFGK